MNFRNARRCVPLREMGWSCRLAKGSTARSRGKLHRCPAHEIFSKVCPRSATMPCSHESTSSIARPPFSATCKPSWLRKTGTSSAAESAAVSRSGHAPPPNHRLSAEAVWCQTSRKSSGGRMRSSARRDTCASGVSLGGPFTLLPNSSIMAPSTNGAVPGGRMME